MVRTGGPWAGPLEELMPKLRQEAARLAGESGPAETARDEDFAWRILPRGLMVAVRRRGDLDMRLEIRLARKEPLGDGAARAKWEQEIGVFAAVSGIEILDGRTPVPKEGVSRFFAVTAPNARDQGKTAVRLIELRYGEVAVGRAVCAICGELTDWWPAGGVSGQRCRLHIGQEPNPEQPELF